MTAGALIAQQRPVHADQTIMQDSLDDFFILEQGMKSSSSS